MSVESLDTTEVLTVENLVTTEVLDYVELDTTELLTVESQTPPSTACRELDTTEYCL